MTTSNPLKHNGCKFLILLLIVFFTYTFSFSQKQVLPNWKSINERGYPEWFADAKLGIFIHWGLYSVPAWSGKEQYAEWFYRGLSVYDTARVEFQEKNFGKGFRYEDYKRLFKAELFDPKEWATLFRESGAKYILLVTKHHDGYCLWDSKYAPDFNSVTSGPKRNIVAELSDAVRGEGLQMGFYYSLPEWTNPLHPWCQTPHDSIGRYVELHMIPQFKELISTYKPTVLFTDGEWFNTAKQWHAEELIAWYYNTVGDMAIVNDRWGAGTEHGFRTPEYSAGITQTNRPWAECRGLGRSFGLNRNEPLSNYLSSKDLIQHFCKLVAAGGGMTLNVGPASDGKIPLLQQERLLDLGKWLKINGEAIYGSRPYKKFYEYQNVSSALPSGTNIDFQWVRNSPVKEIPEDNFTSNFKGYITSQFSEIYKFEVEADDEMEVIIDGKKIVAFSKKDTNILQNDGNVQESANTKSQQNTIFLEAGKKYEFIANHYETSHEAAARLFWSSKSLPREIVPITAFSHKGNTQEQGLKATFSSQKPYICYTQNEKYIYIILFQWNDYKIEVSIDAPKKGSKIVLLDGMQSISYQYKKGILTMDLSKVLHSKITNHDAWVFRVEK